MKQDPLHIAIIPDGNRRWATQQGLQPWKGHERSADTFRSILTWCRESGEVSVLTFWCFSTENWKRSPAEIQVLMRLLDAYLDCEREELKKHRIRVLHSGRRDRLPVSLVKKLMDLEHDVDDPAMILHLAIDYGGKDEVVRAVRRMVAEGELDGDEMTEEAVRAHVDQPGLPDIDLVIRTSGEQRTSNFFLWQAAYAEWVFLQKYFPDFRPEDLAATVEEYRARSRRFGA